MTVRETAHAKINLYLNVGGKRADGFHDIETVMQTVSLSDTLTVTLDEGAPDGVELRILGDDTLATDDSNLVLRAVHAFLSRRVIKGKISITLEKRIPISAGLAGGSADAAATLRALNRLTTEPLSAAELSDLAASLGSDVPFCLVGGTALCKGRGEIVEPMDFCDIPYLLIAKTNESVSTPKAFSALDSLRSQGERTQPTFISERSHPKVAEVQFPDYERPHHEVAEIQSADYERPHPEGAEIQSQDSERTHSECEKIQTCSDLKVASVTLSAVKEEITPAVKEASHSDGKNEIPISPYNSFEDVILPNCPAARSLKSRLLELSAKYALMSGSGPSIFAAFDSEEKLLSAKEILSAENQDVKFFIAKSTEK